MKFNFPSSIYVPYFFFFFQIFLLQKKRKSTRTNRPFSFFSRHTTTTSHLVLRSLWKSADGSSMDGKTPCQIRGNTLLAVARIANAPLTFYTRAEYFPTDRPTPSEVLSPRNDRAEGREGTRIPAFEHEFCSIAIAFTRSRFPADFARGKKSWPGRLKEKIRRILDGNL